MPEPDPDPARYIVNLVDLGGIRNWPDPMYLDPAGDPMYRDTAGIAGSGPDPSEVIRISSDLIIN